MDEKTLAIRIYDSALEFAEQHDAPRSAIAAAMFRAAMQIYVDDAGPTEVSAWLAREAAAFDDALQRSN